METIVYMFVSDMLGKELIPNFLFPLIDLDRHEQKPRQNLRAYSG